MLSNMLCSDNFTLGKQVREINIDQLPHENEDKAWVNAINIKKETPLHIVAKNGKLELFKSLLPYYIDIESTDQDGNTVLHVLANRCTPTDKVHTKKRIDVFCNLLCQGADLNKRNRYGETPFLLACRVMIASKDLPEAIKTIDFLIECGCDINDADAGGYSALHYAVGKCNVKAVKELLKRDADVHLRTKEHKLTPLHVAARHRNLRMVKILLKRGAIVESQEIDEITPLQMSVLKSSSSIVEYLIKNGAAVNYPDKILQLTPLHLAVYQQRHNLFQRLIYNGADVNGKGTDGFTPLHLSSMMGSFYFTKILIHYGAEVNCCNKDGFTPLHLAIIKNHLGEDSKLIGADAIKHGHEKSLIAKTMSSPLDSIKQSYEAVIRLLLRNGANVNALTSSGWSSLHFATKLGRRKFAKMLLENGANVDLREFDTGFTALHFAAANNFKTMVELLIDAGADVNAETSDGRRPIHLAMKPYGMRILRLLINSNAAIDCKTHSQLTPLHMALSQRCREATKMLIDAGVDVNALTCDGRSPMHMAVESNCLDILGYLMTCGATLNCKRRRCLYSMMYICAQMNKECAIKIFGKTTPLLSAISKLEDRRIKQAIFCLAALMDVRDKVSCMPRHSEVTKGCIKIIERLRGCQINAQNFEACNELAPYRFSSGTFVKFHRKFYDAHLFNCLSVLHAVGTHLYVNDCLPFNPPPYRHKTDDERCEKEIIQMTGYSICNNITLYNVFHMKPSRRRFYTKNLDLDDIQMKFKVYHKLITAYYYDDMIKTSLVDIFEEALYKLVNMNLPVLCMDEIFWNLSILDIIATIEATEGID